MTTAQLLLVTVALFVAMVTCVFVGRRLGVRRIRMHGEAKLRGNVVDSAVFGTFALLVSFSFNGAINRLDEHRRVLAAEVNAISTLYLRIDLLPETAQEELRGRVRDYVQSRVELYRENVNPESVAAMTSKLLREQMWTLGVAACKTACSPATMSLFYGALDEVYTFPITQARMRRMHPPMAVWGLLFGLALLTSVLVGYDMAGAKSNKPFAVVFPLVASVVIGVTLDCEFPRGGGLIKLNRFDEMIDTLQIDLRTEGVARGPKPSGAESERPGNSSSHPRGTRT
jgi:hypothetical protein